jgi:hypothetical protein
MEVLIPSLLTQWSKTKNSAVQRRWFDKSRDAHSSKVRETAQSDHHSNDIAVS